MGGAPMMGQGVPVFDTPQVPVYEAPQPPDLQGWQKHSADWWLWYRDGAITHGYRPSTAAFYDWTAQGWVKATAPWAKGPCGIVGCTCGCRAGKPCTCGKK